MPKIQGTSRPHRPYDQQAMGGRNRFICILKCVLILDIISRLSASTYKEFQFPLKVLASKTVCEGFHKSASQTGTGCLKLTTSLVNKTLKFQTLISHICQYFLLKKCEKLLQCKSFSHFFNKKFQHIWL